MLEEDSYKGIVTWGSKGDSFIVKVCLSHSIPDSASLPVLPRHLLLQPSLFWGVTDRQRDGPSAHATLFYAMAVKPKSHRYTS